MSSVHANEESNLKEIVALLQTSAESTKKRNGFTSRLESEDNTARERLGMLLEWFSTHFKDERSFSVHNNRSLFTKILNGILAQTRFDHPENTLRIVICLRMLMRDSNHLKMFTHSESFHYFAEMFQLKAQSYLTCTEEPFVIDVVANFASIYEKLSRHCKYQSVLVQSSIHRTMLVLLSARDLFVLHCALHVLVALAESADLRLLIADHHATEGILQIIHEFDDVSKCYAANLLRILCADPDIREQMMIYDALPILLSVLNDCDQCDLLWHVVWTLVRLCSDNEHANEIRLLGGIPLILNLLNTERGLTCSRYELSSGYRRQGHATVSHSNKEDLTENKLKLYSACCAVLTELALDDRCTQTIVQTNGIYVVAKLILPKKVSEKCKNGALALQRNAFRALRFFFSMERNRKMFKTLFPPSMFQKFIDVGHYVRDSDSYRPLVDHLNSMQDADIETIQENVEELNQNKTPKRFIDDYAIYDILGSGAFGSVYRVKKRSQQTPLALKEVSIGGGGGKSGKERQKREIDEIVRELSIIREQLRHPNVVRYFSTFEKNDKLYIEMELIEGASLQEHFTSLKEKKEPGMGEARLWRVFIQMCLALRYLHCDKKIVHRDLTPNNVMLGENDKVTITDFGLAKQKKDTSDLKSTVGTMMYLCPEMVKNEPYNEKADIWALGCILYQMAMLDPPFLGNNILSIANKIVAGSFPAVKQTDEYSELVQQTVSSCLTVKPVDRPDIVAVSGFISEQILKYTDQITGLYLVAEKRVEKERRRTQHHFYEARRNRQDYQTLFQASQESSERSSKTFEISNGSVTSQGNDESAPSRSNSSDTDVFANDVSDEPTDTSGFHSAASNVTKQTNVANNEKGETPVKKIRIRPVSAGTRQPHPPSPDLRNAAPRRALSFDLTGIQKEEARTASLNRISTSRDFSRGQFSARGRPGSSSGSAKMLSISPSKLRQISDPVQQTLIQLHKIIFIDQLPPTSNVNYRRQIISRYKRALFSPHSRSLGLKGELKKLLIGSHETIDLNFIVEASSLTQRATQESEARELLGNGDVTALPSGNGKIYEEGMTYAQMQTIIERVLQESGYYDISDKPKTLFGDVMNRCRTVPDNLSYGFEGT
uniref:Serine/threonine-protein kinase Nek10 n=1 Tax=Phallusia mammillata TaxID=59560 RepID=A0A6F9DLG2_9ASCI|nr:serine/threonine-protein kinase Nek10 [Phallusia mammillata]